jgi:hypothetical protein
MSKQRTSRDSLKPGTNDLWARPYVLNVVSIKLQITRYRTLSYHHSQHPHTFHHNAFEMRITGLLTLYSAIVVNTSASPILDNRGESTRCSVNGKPAPVTEEISVTSKTSRYYPTLAATIATSHSSVSPRCTSYMAIIDEWRAKLGLMTLTCDPALEANAFKTCVDGHGRMIHELNPGSRAQVLAMGNMNQDFQRIFVGGWLCEKPELKGLDSICTTLSVGWAYSSTGHADILTSRIYTKIGCATSSGITSCDLA